MYWAARSARLATGGSGRAAAAQRRLQSTAAAKRAVVGIRLEDKNRWERRVPLTPAHVQRLVDNGVRVLVQTSTRRVFPDEEFRRAGAEIVEDMRDADLVLSVKEVPLAQLGADKTYMMFSHTHKGQAHNMPMLQTILDRNIRLIDYELLKDPKTGQRLVRFGEFAGFAGMVDFLHLTGQRLLALGYNSPFLNVGMSHTYRTLAAAKVAVETIGVDIARGGLPKRFSPFVFAFTGNGNVTRGAMEIFTQLPHRMVKPSELRALAESNDYDPGVVYGTQLMDEDYIRPRDGTGRLENRADYRAHPEKYRSVFHDEVAPFVTALVNGIYWEPKYPRLLTVDQTAALLARPDNRLIGIADISCDIEGSIEVTAKATTIDRPVIFFNGRDQPVHEDMSRPGLMVMAVDNLPAEMAREASQYFGNALYPFVDQLSTALPALPSKPLPPVLQAAVVAENGRVAPLFQGTLDAALKSHGHTEPSAAGARVTDSPSRRVLLLGAGMVAGPLVDYLAAIPGTQMTIGSLLEKDAKQLVRGRANIRPIGLDISDKARVSQLVGEHDLVVSLVPATMHVHVAEQCVQQRRNMVTASYISPGMKQLHESAVAAGVTLMNEIGLDPGIDHLSAMEMIDDAHARGGKVVSFQSLCGGLPAPEAADNPLQYKFSWSPRGVLAAGMNASRFLRDGKLIETPRGHLFEHAFPVNLQFDQPLTRPLECLPNRDSLVYKELYGLRDATTVFRGTLRYQGFSAAMRVLDRLGCFSESPVAADLASWPDVFKRPAATPGAIASALNVSEGEAERLLASIKSLLGTGPVPARPTVVDALCAHLETQLRYLPGERDMVALYHELVIDLPAEATQGAGPRLERVRSSLLDFGVPHGYTSMAKLVGLPAAIAANLLLEGHGRGQGVVAPMKADWYKPLLAELASCGVRLHETVESIPRA